MRTVMVCVLLTVSSPALAASVVPTSPQSDTAVTKIVEFGTDFAFTVPQPASKISVIDPNSVGGGPRPVPEPASWLMFIAGFGLLGLAMRLRRPRFGADGFVGSASNT